MNFDHPLAAQIEAWASDGQPLVPFRTSEAEFIAAWKESDLCWLSKHPTAGHYFVLNHRRSRLVAMALARELFPPDLHEMCYRAAAGSSLADAMCGACEAAFNMSPLMFARLSVAMRFEGFIEALHDWAQLMPFGRVFEATSALRDVVREMEPRGVPQAGFWLHASQEGFGDVSKYMQQLENERRLFAQALSKRESRGTKRPAAQFKGDIGLGWVPMSFWTHTAAEILEFLDPRATRAVEKAQRIRNDISLLKLSASHRPNLYPLLVSEAEKFVGRGRC